MLYILTALAIAALALATAWLFAHRAARRHDTKTHEEFVGICTFALDQTVRKQSRKAKVLELLQSGAELSNAEIRQALGVSRNSVVNYTRELENEGKIEQIGDAGRGVVYRLKS